MSRRKVSPSHERILGELLADRTRAAEDRQALARLLERIDGRIEPLLALPQRITDLEVVTSANHRANVERLAAIEGDVGDLKTWRYEHDGVGRGVRVAFHAGIAAVSAGLTALGIWLSHLRNH